MNTLNENEIDTIDSAVCNASMEVRNYNGRGMYGDECLGVVGDLPGFATFLVDVAGQDNALAEQLVQHLRADSMGMSDIYYFPGISAEGFDTDDEED